MLGRNITDNLISYNMYFLRYLGLTILFLYLCKRVGDDIKRKYMGVSIRNIIKKICIIHNLLYGVVSSSTSKIDWRPTNEIIRNLLRNENIKNLNFRPVITK